MLNITGHFKQCYIDYMRHYLFLKFIHIHLLHLLRSRISEASSIAHLDKVERGYENMDHYNVDFKREGKALRSISFIQGDRTEINMGRNVLLSAQLTYYILLILSTDDEDEDEEDEDGEATEEGEGASTTSGEGAITATSSQPSAGQQTTSSSQSAAKSAAST